MPRFGIGGKDLAEQPLRHLKQRALSGLAVASDQHQAVTRWDAAQTAIHPEWQVCRRIDRLGIVSGDHL